MNMGYGVTDQKSEVKIILVAEDDDTSYALLQAFLSKENFKLLRSRDGVETVEMFRKNPGAALILMDLKMPVMDGYEATCQIKQINRDVPIIAQTAYALSGDKQKAIDAGCDDYITKPIRKAELLEKINAFLKE
jgi:two-component system, cell cycle response regulator DivK